MVSQVLMMAVTLTDNATLSRAPLAEEKPTIRAIEGAETPCRLCSLASSQSYRRQCPETSEGCWGEQPDSHHTNLVGVSLYGFVLPLLMVVITVAGFSEVLDQPVACGLAVCLWLGIVHCRSVFVRRVCRSGGDR